MLEESEAWSQLVSLTDVNTDPIPISQDKFVIGRAKGIYTQSEEILKYKFHCATMGHKNL